MGSSTKIEITFEILSETLSVNLHCITSHIELLDENKMKS